MSERCGDDKVDILWIVTPFTDGRLIDGDSTN